MKRKAVRMWAIRYPGRKTFDVARVDRSQTEFIAAICGGLEVVRVEVREIKARKSTKKRRKQK